jgi:RNA polymerase sigma factor (sigma-70 family)
VTEPTDAPSPGATPDEGGQADLAAFLACNETLFDKLFASIRRRIPDDSTAVEDIFWNTLYALVAYLDRPDVSEEQHRKLLFGIAKNLICHYWRLRRREVPTPPSDMVLLSDVLVDPYADADRRIDIERALARLTDKQQRALVLVYVDQLTCEEAGDEMGISASAVKKLVLKAKNNVLLHGLLNGQGKHSTTTRRTTQTGTSEAQA